MDLKRLFPGAAAVVVAVSVSIFMSGGGLAQFQGPPSDTEIEALLEESGVGDTYAAMKEFFPDKAAEWRATMADLIVQRRKGVYNSASAINAGAELRRDYAHHLATAPDPLLVAVMQQQHDLFGTFRDAPDTCARLLLEGPVALTSVERQRLTPILNDAGILFEAMHAGMTQPVARDASTENDWIALFDLMRSSGFTDEDIDLVAYPDASAPRYCNAFLGFIAALSEADFDGADRLRAEMAVAMISA